MMTCPLCKSLKSKLFSHIHKPRELIYYQCEVCDLHFMDPKCRLNSDKEKARYLEHSEDTLDTGYQNFISPLVEEVKKRFSPQHQGLDFGSGRTGILAGLLKKEGYQVDLYDPYFANNKDVFQKQYDYICSSEVFEHFYDPQMEIKRLRQMLKPQGVLSVMTLFYKKEILFEGWHYRRDETHVVFYSEKTCKYIAEAFNFSGYQILSERLVSFETT